ncbi:MAG TPA: rhomboid family intramembrane serine protease [Candidatus Krumholzibacteria bacterium]|nr:rhomboid family intramembrane serine protease [Candidatus Krumholzibacteria bacterium]
MYFFYYLPVGIDTDTRRFPLITSVVTGLCVAVFVINRFFPSAVPFDFRTWVYFPGFSPWTASITAAFVHYDYFHIISNLIYLVLFGRYLEDRIGSVPFLLLFLGAAVAGNLAQGWYNIYVLKTGAGIVGASGAISGLMGAFLVRLRHHNVRIAYWVFAPLMAVNRAGRSELHVVFAMALWVLIQVVRGLVQLEGAGANVAYLTHVTGFTLGVGAMLAAGGWRAGQLEGYQVRGKRFLRKGEYYGAQDEFARFAKARPHDGDGQAALARVSLPCGDRAGARTAYRNACECHLRDGKRGQAETVFQEAARAFDDFVLGADDQLNLAFGMERNLKPAAALLAYERFLRAYDDHSEGAFALLRVANLYTRQGRLDRARLCYEQLVARYPTSEWADFAMEHARRLAVS